jgi:hypothetical protein
MRIRICALLLPTFLFFAAGSAATDGTSATAFKYEGELVQAGVPANGTFDFSFRLFDEPTGGTLLGTVSRNGISVAEGRFSVDLDFGFVALTCASRFLETHVRKAGTIEFTGLSPRQPLKAKTDCSVSGNLTVTGGLGVGTPPVSWAALRVDQEGSATAGENQLLNWNNRWGWQEDETSEMLHLCRLYGDWQPLPVISFNRATSVVEMQAMVVTAPVGLSKAEVGTVSNQMALLLNDSTGVRTGEIRAAGDSFLNGGNVGIGTTSPQATLHVAGTARAEIVEITGADLAERFPLTEKVKPGMVVEIDPDVSGQLQIASEPYSKRVAGVISGANDFPVGAVLGSDGRDPNSHPVALSGRVYCWADASFGAINPGDLLTSSATPGHAMKVTKHRKARGAVIGKAMSSLEEGRGLVLVLVQPQ